MEIRNFARKYVQDIPLKEGYELWGTATGIIPYHRKWWILKEDEIVGHLDQGSYEDPGQAAIERRQWAKALGCLGQVCKRNQQTRKFEFVDA